MKFFLVCLIAPLLSLHLAAETSLPLRAGTADGWPPYEYYDPQTKEMTGYSTEVVRAVVERMGRQLAPIQALPWVRAQNMLFGGELDILYSATPSPNRIKLGYLSEEPLARSYWVLFILKSRQQELTYQKLEDLHGYKIGTVKGYTYTPEFWRTVREQGASSSVLTDEQNFKMLLRERVDFVIAEWANGIEITHQLGAEDRIVALEKQPIRVTELHAVFSRKSVDPNTVVEFSQALREFKRTDGFQQLRDRFFRNLNETVSEQSPLIRP